MKKNDIYNIIMLISTLVVISSSVAQALIVSNVTLQSSGVISNGSVGGYANSNYDYTLIFSATSYHVVAKNDSFVYSNTNGVTAFNTMANFIIKGGSAYIDCSIQLHSNLAISGATNAEFTFSDSSKLTLNSDMPNLLGGLVPPCGIFVNNSTNIRVINPSITGAGSSANAHENGIVFYDCTNCVTLDANISNLRMFGFSVGDSSLRNSSSGIVNSTLTYCGWNCIQVGWDNNTIGAYAINNTCAYASDVGISTYGFNCLISGNYVYECYGVAGGGFNANCGIAVEDGAYNTISNNIVRDCKAGVTIGAYPWINSNLVIGNLIYNCALGVDIQTVSPDLRFGYNTVTLNTIRDWSDNAIFNLYSNNDVISFNKISNSVVNTAVHLNQVRYYSFVNNTITMPLSGWSLAFQIEGNNTLIQGNNIQAFEGILINNGYQNRVSQNNLRNCTGYPFIDMGLGTIYEP